jgi:adenosylhomocysteine nucleosidase
LTSRGDAGFGPVRWSISPGRIADNLARIVLRTRSRPTKEEHHETTFPSLEDFLEIPMRFTSTAPLVALALMLGLRAAVAAPACLTECTPRIGIVSAFGQEAAILVGQTRHPRTWVINGNRFTTGVLRGNPVVIVLSGVSMINSTMVTQLMVDHFKVQRLVMSGIAGGVNPAHHVGDVIIPDRWAMPLEVFWNRDGVLPATCGKAADVSCLGLKLAAIDGRAVAPFTLAASGAAGDTLPTGLFMRENFVMTAANAPGGEFRFDYPVDAAMLAVAQEIKPALERCGPKARAGAEPDPASCVKTTPRVIVGGRGVSGTAFLANPQYRTYLFEQLQAQAFEMETAALAHVAYANAIPYIAFRSLSDLAGAEEFNADAVALFASGLAERNEAAVTLSFLEAWRRRARK